MKTLANKLTLLRIALVPLFIGLLELDNIGAYISCLFLLVIAAMTDIYDGKVARSQNAISDRGKLLDPLADKLIVLAALVSFLKKNSFSIEAWLVSVIVLRELCVLGLRLLCAVEGKVVVPAAFLGKLKTVIHMAGVGILLLFLIIDKVYNIVYLQNLSGWIVCIMAIASVISAIDYLIKYKIKYC